MTSRWGGDVAVVTGATSGIGAAIAERLLGAGVRVAALGRRQARLDDLAAAHGDRVLPLAVDLTDPPAIERAFATIAERLGTVRLLVNNAGLGYETSLVDGDRDAYRTMLEVNVMALCHGTQLAVQAMRADGDRGHVVHLSSLSGHRVVGRAAFYGATKHAVRALGEGLRQELRAMGSAIRVSMISPGFVETEFHAPFFGSDDRARQLYARGALQPADVAAAVMHLLEAPDHVEIHDVLLRTTQQTT